MRKKVKIGIPNDQKIKLQELNSLKTDQEWLEPSNKERINVKASIPLFTKYQKEKKYKKNLLSFTSNIFSVLIFLVVTIAIIISIVSQIDFNKSEENINPAKKLSTKINGSWQSSYNGLFVFNIDNTFYWYNSYENQKDNYYRGTYNYKAGLDALNEMGYTEEEFKKEFGADMKLENIYSINLKPNYAYMSGIDITSVELNENETWWYLLMIKEDGTAYGYNKTLDIKYNLIKKAE